LQNLPVVFALDRGGLVGADGPTHHGAFDLSFLTCIPNMVLMTPTDEDECRKMLTTAYRWTDRAPCATRAAAAPARRSTRRCSPSAARQG
jgi:1-deoxy-D-xylulose-5-phosphate synthase